MFWVSWDFNALSSRAQAEVIYSSLLLLVDLYFASKVFIKFHYISYQLPKILNFITFILGIVILLALLRYLLFVLVEGVKSEPCLVFFSFTDQMNMWFGH